MNPIVTPEFLAQRQRLRTIARASLCLVGLEALSTFLEMPAIARLGMAAMASTAAVAGIASILRLWWLDSKGHSARPSQAPVNQPPANPAEGEHTRPQSNDDGHVRRGGTD